MLLISIVTITYNNAEGLKKTLDSVRRQKENYNSIQYIIVDGLSNDNTSQVIEENKGIIDVFISEKDSGIYNAMNKGISLAEGDSIIFMNAGDCFYEDFTLSTFVQKYDFTRTIFSYTMECFEDLKFIRPRNKKHYRVEDFGHQGQFTPKRIYKENLFDETRPIDADLLWQRKIWEMGDYIIANDIVAKFELGGVSNNYTLKNIKKIFSIPKPFYTKIGVIIKFLIQKVFGQKNLYKIIFFRKYTRIK